MENEDNTGENNITRRKYATLKNVKAKKKVKAFIIYVKLTIYF